MSIKSVGGVAVQARHRLSCHCGAVVLELDLPDGIVNPRRCDCSICRRKGAVVASVALAGIRIVQGQEHLRLYQFNTRVAKHYFCGHCGIYTHHQRRSFPDQYGYNVGCLEGINPFLLGAVPVNDGVNHPADRASSAAGSAGGRAVRTARQ
ncbi:MAG: GFA family protein [Burkholderiales bacterium]|nr:GFA family protein [Burkholderiales bacterium]